MEPVPRGRRTCALVCPGRGFLKSSVAVRNRSARVSDCRRQKEKQHLLCGVAPPLSGSPTGRVGGSPRCTALPTLVGAAFTAACPAGRVFPGVSVRSPFEFFLIIRFNTFFMFIGYLNFFEVGE